MTPSSPDGDIEEEREKDEDEEEEWNPTYFEPGDLIFLYSLVRSLYYGTSATSTVSSQRAPLPLELVQTILALVDIRVTLPALRATSHRPITVISRAMHVCMSLWFHSKPWDATKYRGRNLAVQLTTDSKDQGSGIKLLLGSYSWFYVGLYVPTHDPDGEHVQSEPYGIRFEQRRAPGPEPYPKALEWQSHENALGGEDYEERIGMELGPEHELWEVLEDGDYICACAAAQFWGWECHGKEGVLEFSLCWEPVLFPRKVV